MTNKEIQDKAVNLVLAQKTQWEDATAYVTEKVAFNMRNVIRQCRKNYWGIFDVPNDEETGKKKIWPPLTQEACENSAKNHSVDTKDMNFRAKKDNRRMFDKVIKGFTLNELQKMGFSELKAKANRDLDINGTVVWKIKDDVISNVDLLNFYIDPTAESIRKTPAVIERVVMTPYEIKGMKGWLNTDGIQGQEGVEKTGDNITTTTSKQKLVEVFIYEGLAPKSLMTGNNEDKDEVGLRIVISAKGGGSDKEEKGNCHLIELLPKKNGELVKSYEECWMTRVSGRWHGLGTAEKILMMQLWMNLIINTRKTRNEVATLGLFKIRDGSGITPAMIKRLPVNGAIKLKDMKDLEQMIIQGAEQSSYDDENVVKNWAQRITQTFEAITGETMAATTTATTGAIQSRSASTYFVEIKKNIGSWMERVIDGHLLPMFAKKIKKQDIIKICLDVDELREYDVEYADYVAENYVAEKEKEGLQYINVEEIQKLKDNVKADLAAGKDVRYHQNDEEIDLTDYDCEVYVDEERIDKNILTTDLINMAKLAPQYSESIIRKIFDLLGIDVKLTPQQATALQNPNQPTNNPQSATGQLTTAMTGPAMGNAYGQ